ncbi:MAG: glycosyltransferase family 2 protein [Bacteroidales bacterium]|nr:glycosyltransferase family 2 protein [Bacteroidales bacterium]
MRVSLIIPVYNAEATLAGTLRSLSAQRFRDFDITFVDDGSTDRTPELLRSFATESGIPCRIIRQKNSGVASARNTGLDAATGDYVGFVDADDRIEPDALERVFLLLDKYDKHLDIVGWDWKLGFAKNGRLMRQADYDTPLQALQNLMGGTMRWNLWLFMVRREFILRHNLRFIDGANMGEDMQFMIKAFCVADRIIQIHAPLYCYNAVSETSLSRQFNDARRAEISLNLSEATAAVTSSPYSGSLAPYIHFLKLYLKLPLLISGDSSNYELWYRWWPESNTMASANKALPFRTRLLQRMAAKRIWAGVRLYYYLIYRFVYGVLYR